MHAANNVTPLPTRRAKHEYALVPAGRYEACYATDYTATYFREAAKLVVLWRLADPEHLGEIIPAYYAVPALIGKPRQRGRYSSVGRGSKLARDLAALLDARPRKLDGPFPSGDVYGALYEIDVITVTHDHRQRPLPEGAWYSRVDRVVGRVK